MKKIATIIAMQLALALCLTQVSARQFKGDTMSLKQPSGQFVAVVVWGDEYYQDVESTDGYTLVRDPEGWICYAGLSADGGAYVSLGTRYTGDPAPASVQSQVGQRARISPEMIQKKAEKTRSKLGPRYLETGKKRASTLPDTVFGLTIMIDFPDETSTFTTTQIDSFCNDDTYTSYGNFSSIKTYFQWISSGKLTYVNQVYGYVTADSAKSYYDCTDEYGGQRLYSIITKAIKQMEAGGYDFSKLTLNSDGYLMALNVLYAGVPEVGWAQGLWPHAGWYGGSYTPADGWLLGPYQISNLGTDLEMETFTHENGHMVCEWPDFYSYDGHLDNNEIYCFGCGNSKNPGWPSPWQRDFHGWLDGQDITGAAAGTVVTLPANSQDCAIHTGANTGATAETYYIEVRTSTSDHAEPHDGLLIWHNNQDGDNTTEGYPEFQELRPATSSEPCFKAGIMTAFNDNTTPSANWYNGNASLLDMHDVSEAGDTMTFIIGSTLPFIVTKTLPVAINNVAYAEPVLSSGGTGTKTYARLSGSLPPGLSLSASGTVSGTPTQPGVYVFAVVVTDGNGEQATGNVELTVTNNGLNYSYYETGTIYKLPTFSKLTAKASGIVPYIDITLNAREAYFAFHYTGYIYIATADSYTFYTNSDDGSKLYIDGTVVVSNDGEHVATEASGSVTLTAGYHTIQVDYFNSYYDSYYDPVLEILYATSTMAQTRIPSTILYPSIPTEYYMTGVSPTVFATVAYADTLGVADYQGTFTYEITSGELPSGLSLGTATGIISGTTQELGDFPVSLQATCATGLTLQASTILNVTEHGTRYSYYTVGSSMSKMPTFTSLTASTSGAKLNYNFDNQTCDDSYWAYDYSGYIEITTAGTYTFYTSSVDGSKLYINGTKVVGNDGSHSLAEKSGTVTLAAGRHAVEVQYYYNYFYGSTHYYEYPGLTVMYELPGTIAKTRVPDSVLFLLPGSQQPHCSQEIALKEGWNLVSTYVSPADSSVEAVFGGALANVREVKSTVAHWNASQATAFNSLGQITSGEGYLVNMSAADTISLSGTLTTRVMSSPGQGWNLVGYPRQLSHRFEKVIDSTAVEKIKNLDGAWMPGNEASTIFNFEPGKAWYIKGK